MPCTTMHYEYPFLMFLGLLIYFQGFLIIDCASFSKNNILSQTFFRFIMVAVIDTMAPIPHKPKAAGHNEL